jgi:hypothetical protein
MSSRDPPISFVEMFMRGLIMLVCLVASILAMSRIGGSMTGTWACLSMSAGSYTGRSCRLEPWLRLNRDNTYEWGREKGTWDHTKGVLSFSARNAKGRVNIEDKLIVEYDLSGKHYVLTLYRRRQ